jgi:hypothetical protein
MYSQVVSPIETLRTNWTTARLIDRQLLELRTSIGRRSGLTWGDELGGVGLVAWTHPWTER